MNDHIIIQGAREHNLKNINVRVPRNRLVVLTGISGSGKSSLAFDTIYAEGQRRYVESLSAYARQFLGQMEKPDVDHIEGLSPAISIDQKTTSRNPRSTVGTVTEIYDYMRLMYARIGVPHCPQCGREINRQTVDQIVDQIMALPENTRIHVLAPVIRGRKGEYSRQLEHFLRQGFTRARIDGEVYDLTDAPKLERYKKHEIDILVDRLIIRPGLNKRLSDSLEVAMKLAEGLVIIQVLDGEETIYSSNYACSHCGISIEELTPRMFSFNSPYGACPACTGLGELLTVDPDLVIPDPGLSLADGAITAMGWSNAQDSGGMAIFEALAAHYGFSVHTPVRDLPGEALQKVLYGTGREKVEVHHKGYTYRTPFEGVIPGLQRRYEQTQSPEMREYYESLMTAKPCPECGGLRLKPAARAVTVGGKSLPELTALPITEIAAFLENLKLSPKEQVIMTQIMKELRDRLGFLVNVGLEYLTLSRAAATLSGGEAQRIRLATQIGSRLTGVVYILDEPSIGLHQRDNRRLLQTLQDLRDLGNTLIVVEHDEETIRSADHIIDIGPGAGIHGGYLVAQGSVEDIIACEQSVTGQYLCGKRSIPVPPERRKPDGRWLTVRGASQNNLKHIDVSFPVGLMTCVTGVSGSGKSSLVNEILHKALARDLNRAHTRPGQYDAIEGMEHLDKVIAIDQSPIGRTPRSNPATYTGTFNLIRELFAQTADAKARGYGPGRFSFNVKGGRCEACSGDGIIKIEMHFLPDVYVPCEVCKGRRYNRETLEVRYKGRNIYEVLDMTVEEALDFFENIPRIRNKIQTLYDVGLGYIKLGQASTQLSGGEAQRIKLATELSRRSTGRTLYILDEPTTGLHMADVDRLVLILQALTRQGNTVVIIEHNLDVIKVADYIVDLGPEGGDKGGQVIVAGTPEEVAAHPDSATGQFLKQVLAQA